MKKGDVITVFSPAGEIVGKYVKEESGSITLEEPRLLMQNEQGSLGFAKGVCVSGQLKPQSLTINNYIFVTPSNDEFEKAYRRAITGLLV